MFSKFQLTQKYLRYWLKGSNGKGHGIHSPFVFEFVKFVLNDPKEYPIYKKAEAVRAGLLKDNAYLEVKDLGAGSSVIKTKKRKIKDIAAASLKPKKYSRLLFRIAQYYHAQNILELGTSLGITTAYLASAKDQPQVTTMEGSEEIANIAQQNFGSLELDNINIITGNFNDILPPFLKGQKIDLAFLDGNHRRDPTVNYFKEILSASHNDTVLVFDDIHWSEEMEEAWKIIRNDEAVTLSLDLFFIGIVFLRKEFKVKQHFSIRF